MSVTLTDLHVYPIKSCRGIALESARLAPTGLTDDRHWMLVRPNGRFVTQRELPRMALVATQVDDDALTLTAPGMHGESQVRARRRRRVARGDGVEIRRPRHRLR